MATAADALSVSLPVVAVLGGTGKEGGGLAFRWAQAGYRVLIGSRDAGRAQAGALELAEALASARAARALADQPAIRLEGLAHRDAAAQADIVVLAVPFAAQQALADELAPVLQGRIVVDVTVPLVPPRVDRVQLPAGGSAVESMARRLGEGVRVVSAFQNISATHLRELDHEIDCDVLVCGDDPEAREAVIALSAAAGLRAWHAGPLANSVATEALTSLLIAINKRYKVPGAGIRITGVPDERRA
jgi:NADPH-dependent F420 reductase